MIPVSKPYYPEVEIDIIMEKVRSILVSGRLVNGPYLQEFENKFSDYIGCQESVGVNSGTSALELALRCINVEDGDVITTTNTCTAVINSIIFAGGKPVLVDINKQTLATDPEKLKEEINPETKAVILVHTGGNIQKDIGKIKDICKDKKIVLVEDSCRALGAKYRGKLAGNFGDIACFSFYASKLLSTGNGGMLTTDDPDTATKAKILREHGRKRTKNGYLYTEIGHNMILDEIGSILGLSQLKMIDDFIENRIEIAKMYDSSIKSLEYLDKASDFEYNPEYRNSYYRYPILVNEYIDVEDFESYMNNNGIQLGHFFPMVHQTDVYRKNRSLIRCGELSNATFLSRRLFTLPIFSSMTQKQTKKVMQTLINYK